MTIRATMRLLAVLLLLTLPATTLRAQASAEFERLVGFGKEFFGLNDFVNAYEQFAKADALQPDQPAVLYNMALLLAKTGRFSESQIKVDRYLQLYPSGVEAALVMQLQRKLEFQREWQKARRAEQDFNELFTKGQYRYSRNELDAALALFLDAEQKRPGEPAAVFNQAVLYEKLGDFAKAAERYRRYLEIEGDPEQKGSIDQRIVSLEGEIEDMRTKIVCSFCGHRLHAGATWCHRCWHGPYFTASPVWNSRPCVEGASATRATYFYGDKFNKNESLPCMHDGSMRDALRYSPSRQRSIQEARKAEGWTYAGEVIQSWRDKDGSEVRYQQGPEYLERIDSASGGEIQNFSAHKAGEAWLLDSEQWFIDGQKYTSRFTFDADNRIAQQQVEYQNTAACNHVISMSADYQWEGLRLAGAAVRGGYDGFAAEGSPRTDWQVAIVNSFDEGGRLAKEDLTVTSFTKTYAAKPIRKEREQVSTLFPTMRVRKPITDVARTGDLCGVVAGRYVANLIDLRPFYAISPNLAIALPNGIARVTVTLAYPPGFKP